MKGAYILIPLLCALCAGCDSKDESLMSTREIGFSTTVASSEAEPGTRAEATTDNLTEMGVFAYFTGTGNFSNGSSTPNHLYNQSVKKTGGVWTYSPIRYWPANAKEKVSLRAPYRRRFRQRQRQDTDSEAHRLQRPGQTRYQLFRPQRGTRPAALDRRNGLC